jgi:hypothetical protein
VTIAAQFSTAKIASAAKTISKVTFKNFIIALFLYLKLLKSLFY